MRVVVDGKRLREARMAKLLTTEQLAKKAGLGARTQRKMESGSAVRLSTLELVAQVLAIDVAKLVVRASDAESAPKEARTAATRYEPTELERIAEFEDRRPYPRPIRMPGGKWEPLTARRLQEIYTAYVPCESARVFFDGIVRTHRGASAFEAKLLGSRAGVAARFYLVRATGAGVLGVTVHTREVSHTQALLAKRGKKATVLVRVTLVPEADVARGRGFDFFGARTKRPWGLVVEEVR